MGPQRPLRRPSSERADPLTRPREARAARLPHQARREPRRRPSAVLQLLDPLRRWTCSGLHPRPRRHLREGLVRGAEAGAHEALLREPERLRAEKRGLSRAVAQRRGTERSGTPDVADGLREDAESRLVRTNPTVVSPTGDQTANRQPP